MIVTAGWEASEEAPASAGPSAPGARGRTAGAALTVVATTTACYRGDSTAMPHLRRRGARTLMILDGLEPGVQYILAISLATYWLLTGSARAYERVTLSRTAARRSARDADLAEAKHRDDHVIEHLRERFGAGWRKGRADRRDE